VPVADAGQGPPDAEVARTDANAVPADAAIDADNGVPITCLDPRFPKVCPARNGERAVCVTPGADCSTIKRCPDGLRVCGPGAVVDCRYPNCTPTAGCTDPSFPVACPARDGVGPDCWSKDTDCNTVTLCEGQEHACKVGFTYDCARSSCVQTPVAPCGGTPATPQYCPASGTYPGGCWAAGIDCTTVLECSGGYKACPNGQVADCDGQCLPPAQCPYATTSDACGKCLRQKCCSRFNACLADPSCSGPHQGPVWDGLLDCATSDCPQACGL
jgi:hypothetical protein